MRHDDESEGVAMRLTKTSIITVAIITTIGVGSEKHALNESRFGYQDRVRCVRENISAASSIAA